jgi:nicotinamidase/pyrazinamidase
MVGDLLVVADMLRGFCEEGHALYCGPPVREIIPFLRNRVAAYDAAGKHIVFLMDNHAPDDLEFRRFPPHCIRGTREQEVIPELAEWARPERIVPKTRYGGFYGTDLEERVRALQPSLVEITGVCTNICVLYTAEEFCNRDIPTQVPRAGVTSFDLEAHEWALSQMEKVLGVNVF